MPEGGTTVDLRVFVVLTMLTVLLLLNGHTTSAGDWSQWMGTNRNGKATGFVAPQTWPSELKKVWSVDVGDGVATPALVGERLFVFSRQDNQEIARCLNVNTGEQVWSDSYASSEIRGPASGFQGPRASPTVADGKVVVFGAHGHLSCYSASTGKLLWRNESSVGSVPRFFTSSSPLIVGEVCVVQHGGEEGGSIAAYELASGNEKWKLHTEGTSYGSPAALSLSGQTVVIAETDQSILAIDAVSGKQLWDTPFAGTERDYNAVTPIFSGEALIIAGANRGFRLVSLERANDQVTARDLWKNADNSVIYNTPVLKDGFLYGLSAQDVLFCLDTKSGTTKWSGPLVEGAPVPAPSPTKGKGRGPGGRGRGGFGSRPGYGSIVDAGSVLFTLSPAGTLGVIGADSEKLVRIAKYKVAEGQTYAYPIVTESHIYIKDGQTVTKYALN